jgi:hypothetical protein
VQPQAPSGNPSRAVTCPGYVGALQEKKRPPLQLLASESIFFFAVNQCLSVKKEAGILFSSFCNQRNQKVSAAPPMQRQQISGPACARMLNSKPCEAEVGDRCNGHRLRSRSASRRL